MAAGAGGLSQVRRCKHSLVPFSSQLRRVQNRIAKLHDSNGDIQTDVDAVAHIAVEYFRQLFSGATSLAMEEVLDCVQPCVTDGINAQLCLSYSRVEVE